MQGLAREGIRLLAREAPGLSIAERLAHFGMVARWYSFDVTTGTIRYA